MNQNTKQARSKGKSCLAEHTEGPRGKTNTVSRTVEDLIKGVNVDSSRAYKKKKYPNDGPRRIEQKRI